MSEYSRSLADSHQGFARPKTPAERLHLDLVLLLPVMMIMALGLFVLFSASDSDWVTVNRQLRSLIIGFGVLLAVAQLRVDTIQRWAPTLYLAALLLLLLVPFFGVGAKGAQRWLSLGFMRFQPSEIMKIAMPLAVAAWLVPRGLPTRPSVTLAAIMIIALNHRDPGLGTWG